MLSDRMRAAAKRLECIEAAWEGVLGTPWAQEGEEGERLGLRQFPLAAREALRAWIIDRLGAVRDARAALGREIAKQSKREMWEARRAALAAPAEVS